MKDECQKSKVEGQVLGKEKPREPVGFGTGFLHPSQAVAGS